MCREVMLTPVVSLLSLLTGGSWLNPQVDVWTSDAHQWGHMNPALPKFEKYP